MKSMGMCRVDKAGRVSIPHKVRREMALSTGTKLEIYAKEDSITLEKAENRCVFCQQKEDLRATLNGLYVCTKCCNVLEYLTE